MKNVNLFEDSLQTMLPDDYGEMPPEAVQMMFPSERRPQVIKGSSDGSFVTFSLIEKTLSRQQLFVASRGALSLLLKFYPSCHNQRIHIIPLGNNLCAWFSFLAQGNNNILFIISINGKMLLGSCGCLEGDQKRLDELKMAFLSVKELPAGRAYR